MMSRSGSTQEETLYEHLLKLSSSLSTQESSESSRASALEQVLEILWQTRKTGLKPQQKSFIQSLLNLPPAQELNTVLACLRSLIRKTVHGNFTVDDIQKLLPMDFPLELQRILLMLLQKYQNQWKMEASEDQSQRQGLRVSQQIKVSAPLFPPPFLISEIPLAMSARADDSHHVSHSNLGAPTSIPIDSNMLHLTPVSVQEEVGLPDNLATLPLLKSMTWTMEKQSSKAANRIAIITLKLQDHAKSPFRETEVNFQLSRDTIEAMLRSMTQIYEQFSNNVEIALEPPLKKQKQQELLQER